MLWTERLIELLGTRTPSAALLSIENAAGSEIGPKKVFGNSIVARGPAERYDVAVTLLIQLLFEYPDDLKPVAGAVRILAGTTQEIDGGR